MFYSLEAVAVLAVAAFALGLMTSREHLRTLAVFVGEKISEMASTLAELIMVACRWLKEMLISIACSLLMALAAAAACVLAVVVIVIVMVALIGLVLLWILKQVWERVRPFLIAFLAALLGVLAAIWWLAFLILGSEVAYEVGNADWLMIGLLVLAVIALVTLSLALIRWVGAILAAMLLIALMIVAAIIGGVIGVVVGLALLALILGLASLLAEGLGRAALLLGAIGVLLITLLKGCAGETPEMLPRLTAPLAPSKVAEAPRTLLREDWEVRAIIWARPNDGCIRMTRRGGHPLTLAECIALTGEYGRQTIWFNGLIIAPMVGKHEIWYLMENRATGELRWIQARHTAN